MSLRAREQARRAEAQRRAEELRRGAAIAARRLVDCELASAVWLFGSLAWGSAHSESDVDLLVEGMTLGDWSRAVALVEAEVSCGVDLVRAEEAPGGLVERVRHEGIRLA